MKKFLIFILLFFQILNLSVFAEETTQSPQDLFSEEKEKLMELIPDEGKELLQDENGDLTTETIMSLNPVDIIKSLLNLMKEKAAAPIKALLSIIVIIMLCSIAEGMKSTVEEKGMSDVFSMVAALGISTVIAIPIISLIKDVVSIISQAGDFMKLFIPVFAGIMLAGGESVSAGGYQMIAFSAAEIATEISEKFILPLLSIYLTFAISSSVSSEMIDLSKIGKAIKSFASKTLIIITTIFCGILTAQRIVGHTAETSATKTLKFVISSTIPAIGPALSDALSSLQSSVKIVKSTVGVLGVLAPIIIMLPVIINVLMWQLSLKIGTTISGVFHLERVENLLSDISSVIGLLVSITLFILILLVVTTTIILMIGGST